MGRQEIYWFISPFIGKDDYVAAQPTNCVVCSRKVEINYGSRRGDLEGACHLLSAVFLS